MESNLIERKAIALNPYMFGNHLVVVNQWNSLADVLCFDFPKVDPEHLKWEYRKPLINAEINGVASDIFTFEEIDKLEEIAEMFDDHDYKHISKFNDFHKDGPAIFWRRSKFELLHFHFDRFGGRIGPDSVEKLSTRVYGIVVLKHKET